MMAYYHGGKQITGIYHGTKEITKKYHGSKLVWEKFSARLPKEYQEVEYIESAGNSWIDTGFVFDSNTKVIVDVSLVHNKDGGTYILGGRKTYKDLDYTISMNDVGKTGHRNTLLNIYGSQSFATETYLVDNVQYHIFKDKNNLYSNGKLISTLEKEVFKTPTTAYLFNVHISGTISANNKPMVGKMFSCVIYDGDNCVRNFVPCYRKSDKKSGMYDTISNKFFASETDVDFIAGPYVRCKKLNFIENPNSNYIDLQMKMASAYTTEVVYQYNKYSVGFLFGSRSLNTDRKNPSSDVNYAYSILLGTTKENFDVCDKFVSANRYQQDYNSSKRTVKINKTGVYINDVLTKLFVNDSFKTYNNAFIFSCPYCLIGDTKTVGFVDAKIYSLKIMSGDILKMDLIPCKIGNRIGLLDNVTKVFFTGEIPGKNFAGQ